MSQSTGECGLQHERVLENVQCQISLCKQASCLGDNAYEDSSSVTQLFYKEMSTFYYLALLHHVQNS